MQNLTKFYCSKIVDFVNIFKFFKKFEKIYYLKKSFNETKSLAIN